MRYHCTWLLVCILLLFARGNDVSSGCRNIVCWLAWCLIDRWAGRNNRGKIPVHVEFGQQLDVQKYCSDNLHADSYVYNLSAVVMHHGRGFGSGHYTSFCWNDEAGTFLFLRLLGSVDEIPPPPTLTSSSPHLRCDVGVEEGEYKWKLSLCYSIAYYYNGAQRYEQFLQVGWLYRALILLGLAFCFPSVSVSSVLIMVLSRY